MCPEEDQDDEGQDQLCDDTDYQRGLFGRLEGSNDPCQAEDAEGVEEIAADEVPGGDAVMFFDDGAHGDGKLRDGRPGGGYGQANQPGGHADLFGQYNG